MHDTPTHATPNGRAALRPDWLLAMILALAAFFLLTGLGDRPLWQDEAETACLARAVLVHGLPVADDGVNIVSQEERREFTPEDGAIWRWSPWLQIYLSALGLALFGDGAEGPRLPFALAGLACVALTYLLVRRHFGDRAWALCAASLLTLSVPFLLFSRQGRYYSVGTLLVLLALYAYLSDWRRKWGPFFLAAVSLGLLFHANYLLFLSFAPPAVAAALLVDRERLAPGRLALLSAATMVIVLPGFFMYGIGAQGGMFDILLVPENLMLYFADLVMFMLPLPVCAYLVWRWRGFFTRLARPADPGERFVLFSALVILLSILLLALIPQRFFRYIVHLLPLCAIILGWLAVRLWSFSKTSAALLFLLLSLTNWLNIIPLERLKLVNRPWQNDFRMLTSPNFPVRLFLTELFCGYPDVNAAIIDFFKAHARPGQTILAEYGDLPLQFHSGLRVIGGLQGPIDPSERPDWVLLRRTVRVNRDRVLFGARAFTMSLDLDRDYERVPLPRPDETFGNRADPSFHSFIPVEPPQEELQVYRRREGAS